jgi:Xaa-Pro dipeptidase
MLAPPIDAPEPSPMLLNRAQVERALGAHGLDGLVAAQAANVHYLSAPAHCGSEPGDASRRFAVLPASDAAPAALVLGRDELPLLVAAGGTWMASVVAYPTGADADWPLRAGSMPTPTEQQWLALRERSRAASHDGQHGGRSAPGIAALVRALGDAGLDRATLGIDDPRLAPALRAAGLEHATFVPAAHVFREIRRVKSAAEIAALRQAARATEMACLEAASQVHEGAEWLDIENHFIAELASRSGRGLRLACGPVGLPAQRVRRGEPTTIDALGRHRGYHAAFGRTVVVGAPSADLLRRNAAMQRGCLEACDALRPGMRGSEFASLCVRAVRAHGFPEFGAARLRSIGLDADDDAGASPLDDGALVDAPLEAGAVVGIALSYVEIGWGAAHLADMLLVTPDGAEPLTSMQMDLLVVP